MMVERKVPGALDRMEKGEIIPEWEYVTEGKLGWEYRQVLAGKFQCLIISWLIYTVKRNFHNQQGFT